MNKTNSFIGAPIERVEDLRLLRGKGLFIDDVERDGMAYAVILRSNVAHGMLRRVDAADAQRMPGVIAILTARDIGTPVPSIPLRHFTTCRNWCLMSSRSLPPPRCGMWASPLQSFSRRSHEIAEDALEHIRVEIDPLRAIVSCREFQPPQALLCEATGTNRAITYSATRGNAQADFAGSYSRRERLRTNRHTAAPMEMRGLLAEWNEQNGHLTVNGAAKVPFTTRKILSKLIRMPIEAIDMIEVDVGGGFRRAR